MAEINLDNLPKKGEVVTFQHRGASFQMRITNARIRYGQIDVQIAPVDGAGSFWVTYASLTKTTASKVNENAEVGVFDAKGELIR